MKISLCMIVKDEEKVLARCLESAKEFADEIIVVDTGSQDRSMKIAQSYTPFLYTYVWHDDFSAARNFAFSKATGDYLLWLDADDIIPEKSLKLAPTLREMLEKEQPDMVMCPYDIAFDEAGKPCTTFFRERFMRRDKNFIWQGRVHECIAPHGKIARCDFRISHLGSDKVRGRRNLHIYQKWAAEELLSPRDKFYYGRELYYHKLYTEAIAVLEDMLSGDGWYVNKIDACRVLCQAYYYANDRKMAYTALFRSFLYGEPRAFILCEIANLFREDGKQREAIYWYEAALSCRDHSAEGDFEEPAAHTLTPLLGLVCSHHALGEFDKALEYHKKTEELFPTHPSVLYNRKFFEDIGLL